MSDVFKRKRKKNGKRALSKTWYCHLPDAATGARKQINLHLRDKDAARERRRQLITQRENEAVGLRPPAALEKSMSRPIMEHIEDYVRQLAAKKCSGMYVYNCRNCLRIIFEGCDWKVAREANMDGFCQWRTSQTKAPKTLREFQTTFKAFFRWLKRMRRIAFDPFEDLENVRLDGRKARVRRPLMVEQFRLFLEVVSEEHRLAYFVAANTGMRRGDMRALTWGVLTLDGPEPKWLSRAETAKNREDAERPFHPAVRDAFLEARPDGWKPGDKVFAKDAVPSMHMHRKYLDLAGIAYKTENGQTDFHALRKMFCSNLNANGVTLVCAALLMRHKDHRQTASTYNDPHQMHLAERVAQLPILGTFEKGTRKGTQTIGPHGHASSHMDSNGQSGDSPKVIDYQKHSPELAATGTDGPLPENGCPTRIRT